MRRRSGTALTLTGAVGLIAAALAAGPAARAPGAEAAQARDGAAEAPREKRAPAEIPRPSWKVGDSWVIETVTDRVQERAGDVEPGAAIRWRFTVAALEPLAGRECYRIDIECLAQGRVRPRTSLWVDARTMTLREVRTQLAVAGRFHTIQESYDSAPGQATPVLTPLNALPIDLPAFVPAGAKALDSYTYVSQPLPAGAKPGDMVRFAHTVRQEAAVAGSKALEDVPTTFAKDLAAKPVVEVRIADTEKTVTQLWQSGQPWPVYTTNGRTKAKLVSVGRAPN